MAPSSQPNPKKIYHFSNKKRYYLSQIRVNKWNSLRIARINGFYQAKNHKIRATSIRSS